MTPRWQVLLKADRHQWIVIERITITKGVRKGEVREESMTYHLTLEHAAKSCADRMVRARCTEETQLSQLPDLLRDITNQLIKENS